MESNERPEIITLELGSDEALILDAMFARFDKDGSRTQGLSIENAAERPALWALQAALERVLVPPFQESYSELLEAACKRLIARSGQ